MVTRRWMEGGSACTMTRTPSDLSGETSHRAHARLDRRRHRAHRWAQRAPLVAAAPRWRRARECRQCLPSHGQGPRHERADLSEGVQVRQLNLRRAFARNTCAGGAVRRRETRARTPKCAFRGQNRRKNPQNFARATRAQGRAAERNTCAQGKKSVRGPDLVGALVLPVRVPKYRGLPNLGKSALNKSKGL